MYVIELKTFLRYFILFDGFKKMYSSDCPGGVMHQLVRNDVKMRLLGSVSKNFFTTLHVLS